MTRTAPTLAEWRESARARVTPGVGAPLGTLDGWRPQSLAEARSLYAWAMQTSHFDLWAYALACVRAFELSRAVCAIALAVIAAVFTEPRRHETMLPLSTAKIARPTVDPLVVAPSAPRAPSAARLRVA